MVKNTRPAFARNRNASGIAQIAYASVMEAAMLRGCACDVYGPYTVSYDALGCILFKRYITYESARALTESWNRVARRIETYS